MPSTPPPRSALKAFGVGPQVTHLPGGQGMSWLAGGIVLKPGDEPFQQWLGEALADRWFDGVRVPRPVLALDGTWAVDGWTATEYVEASTPDLTQPATWRAVIAAGRRFHESVAEVPCPDFHGARTDPWGVADRVAWREEEMEFVPRLAELAARLLALPDPEGSPQLVHLDLSGNVLFTPLGQPVIIDISPYWRPRSYAEGVVMADAACYHGARRADLDAAGVPVEAVARGLLFRLATTNGFALEHRRGVDLEDEAIRFERAAGVLGV